MMGEISEIKLPFIVFKAAKMFMVLVVEDKGLWRVSTKMLSSRMLFNIDNTNNVS